MLLRQTRQLATKAGQVTDTITWPTYFRYRKSRRIYGLAASVPTTALGLVAGGGYFMNLEAEPGETLLGITPVYVYIMATVSCVGLGFLAGPALGNAVWRLQHRSLLSAIEAKDKVFFEHVARNRGDPSKQFVSNPVPDYYGEKVGSLREYRRWLRDQYAYNKKAEFE